MTTRRFTATGPARRPATPEVEPLLDAFCRRLRLLGATADEIAGVREAWDDPDGWVLPRQRLLALNDFDLRRLIVDARVEYVEHTTVPTVDPEALAAEAHQVVTGTAQEVRAWVDGDRDRAIAALTAERAGRKRVTLLAYLEAQVGS